MNKLLEFLCPSSNSLAEVFKKITIVILIALVLMIVVRVVDGDNHRLGTITIDLS